MSVTFFKINWVHPTVSNPTCLQQFYEVSFANTDTIPYFFRLGFYLHNNFKAEFVESNPLYNPDAKPALSIAIDKVDSFSYYNARVCNDGTHYSPDISIQPSEIVRLLIATNRQNISGYFKVELPVINESASIEKQKAQAERPLSISYQAYYFDRDVVGYNSYARIGDVLFPSVTEEIMPKQVVDLNILKGQNKDKAFDIISNIHDQSLNIAKKKLKIVLSGDKGVKSPSIKLPELKFSNIPPDSVQLSEIPERFKVIEELMNPFYEK